jgi:hypothetical protein
VTGETKSEWMKIMLEEIDRKKAEQEQMRAEEDMRAQEQMRAGGLPRRDEDSSARLR